MRRARAGTVVFACLCCFSATSLAEDVSRQWSAGPLGFGPGDRLLLKEVSVKGASPQVREPFLAMLKSVLLDAGVRFVATPEDVRQESAQRREERGNDEVQQSTLPEEATIMRETVEARVTLDLTHSEKDLQALLAPLTRKHPVLGGVGLETRKTTAVVTLQAWDNETQTSANQLVAIGQEKDYSELIVGVLPVIARQARSEQEKRELKATADALTKLRDMVREKLQAQNPPGGQATATLRGHVLGVEGKYVILDIGRNNGVQPGMMFAVARVVTHGNVRTHLPPSATLRVATVDGNSCAAEVVTGDLAKVSPGDLATPHQDTSG